ncbi:alpha/beta fold hydrolase [Tropicimonas sp. TH_r6]|uniref:alpha/beta hydrolase n=1 Tax=Tropicimonas sp. TH_r6 TaxID=3082085 RepID=UPI002952FCDA|nr:alpha/beta hydrolase [Tropicimonas sp. TH_r6]MDV7142490.1 alpha/beta fold hydrolase [Tropicimonas sp. TH_r6]
MTMPLVRVDTDGDRLCAPHEAEQALYRALDRASEAAPVVVLIHGYTFSPALDQTSPHRHILSLSPERDCWKALSWPRALGLGSGAADEPLCIALGWEARGSLWQAYRSAEATGRALAGLIRRIRRIRPGRSVDVLAHSLGCRVALSALPHLPARAMGRAVLMAPAEMRSVALRCLDTEAGRGVEILNITSRENGVYDRLLEWLVAPLRFGDQALGTGLSERVGNWIDVNIDWPETRDALAAQGFPIPASDKRICHWSVYLRSGLFPFYRAVLHREVALRPLKQPPRPTSSLFRIGTRLIRPLPFAS